MSMIVLIPVMILSYLLVVIPLGLGFKLFDAGHPWPGAVLIFCAIVGVPLIWRLIDGLLDASERWQHRRERKRREVEWKAFFEGLTPEERAALDAAGRKVSDALRLD